MKKVLIVVSLSAIVGLGLGIYLFPPFVLNYESSFLRNPNDIIFYADMDNDGNHERILANSVNDKVIELSINSTTDAVWQENFYGRLSRDYVGNTCNLDGDDYLEFVVAYVRNDSIFFGAIEFKTNERIVEEVFLSTLNRVGQVEQDFTIAAEAQDLDFDGKDELILVARAGFGMRPRQIFIYYHENVQLYTTPPEWETSLMSPYITDMNNDGELELIVGGYAPGNSKDTTIAYHDHNTYVMVFDKFLKKHEGEFSHPCRGCNALIFENRDLVYLRFFITEEGNLKDILYQLHFEENQVQFSFVDTLDRSYGFVSDQFPTLASRRGNAFDPYEPGIFNEDFSFVPLDLPNVSLSTLTNPRGSDYYIGHNDQLIAFVNENFDYQSIELPDNLRLTNRAFLATIDGNLLLHIVYETECHTYELQEQPYWLQRIAFALACALLGGLIWVGGRYIIETRLRERQQRLMSLRVRALRNQLEPHFALNLMSSIKLHLLKNDVLAAEELFDLYTKILKYTLSGAEEIGAKLSDELKYVSTYLEIEQKQNDQLKSFHIEVDPELGDYEVPKMLIQEHVENALKHGIRKLGDQSGHLEISARKINGMVEISIADNGIGRVDGFMDSGKGIALTYELLEIFNTLTKKKVVQQFTDLPKGTKVTITAQL